MKITDIKVGKRYMKTRRGNYIREVTNISGDTILWKCIDDGIETSGSCSLKFFSQEFKPLDNDNGYKPLNIYSDQQELYRYMMQRFWNGKHTAESLSTAMSAALYSQKAPSHCDPFESLVDSDLYLKESDRKIKPKDMNFTMIIKDNGYGFWYQKDQGGFNRFYYTMDLDEAADLYEKIKLSGVSITGGEAIFI